MSANQNSDYVRIVDAHHADAVRKAEQWLPQILPPGQHYVLIVVDPPSMMDRKASWIGTFNKGDVKAICQTIADSIAS